MVRILFAVATAFFLLAASGTGFAQTIDVTVTIMQFEQINDPDPAQVVDAIDGADTIGDGDFFARVRVGANSFQDTRGSFQESATIMPFWEFTQEVDNELSVPVVIQIWDADPIENNDDIIDVSPLDNVQDVVATLNLANCTWSVDGMSEGFISLVQGDGDREHFGALEGGERGRLFFGIACGPSGDIDGDGISDTVERLGIFNSDGDQLVDMAALGADPCRPDVAVEIDFMDGGGAGHNHRPTDAAIDMIRDAFNASNIPRMDPADCPYPGFPVSNTGAGLLAVIDDAFPEQATMRIEDMSSFRSARMDRELWPYFHYAVFAHDILINGSTGRSGRCCRNVKDFVVSLGSFAGPDTNGNPQNGTDAQQAGTFMHELGHALGLAHWGSSNIDVDQAGNGTGRNCKPNYLSVMNYFFQFGGLINDDTGVQAFDYSRAALPTLNESSLNETAGISDGPIQTVWCGPGGNLTATPARGDMGVDWDGSGPPPNGTGIVLDIAATNASGGSCCRTSGGFTASPGDRIAGFNDWANISFRAVMAAGADEANEVFDDEMTVDDAERMETYWQNRLRCFPPASGAWEIAADCTIWRDVTAPGDMRITRGATLKVAPGVRLDVDLASRSIRVEAGSRLLIESGAVVN